MVSSADIFKVCGSDFLVALSMSSHLIMGLLSSKFGGRSLRTLSIVCRFSGRWCLFWRSLTTCMIDFCWSLTSLFQSSTIFLQGWFFSIRLALSYRSRAAFCLLSSRGWTLADISHADVGEDLIPPQISLKAWFCILSRFSLVLLLHRFWSTML